MYQIFSKLYPPAPTEILLTESKLNYNVKAGNQQINTENTDINILNMCMYLCVREGGMERKIRETKQRKRVKTQGMSYDTERKEDMDTERGQRQKERTERLRDRRVEQTKTELK